MVIDQVVNQVIMVIDQVVNQVVMVIDQVVMTTNDSTFYKLAA